MCIRDSYTAVAACFLRSLIFFEHKLRIIGYISEKNWKNFQAVQNRIIGKKLSIIASCLVSTWYTFLLSQMASAQVYCQPSGMVSDLKLAQNYYA